MAALFWVVWYPVAYWTIMAVSAVVGAWLALTETRLVRAIWTSPDRGIGTDA